LGKAIPVLSVKPKRGWFVFWEFFKIGLCSAISFKRSRRGLSSDVAEQIGRSMLKTTLKCVLPRFNFIPKTGILFPKTGISFYCGGGGRENLSIPVAFETFRIRYWMMQKTFETLFVTRTHLKSTTNSGTGPCNQN